jgi:hypothetical protein
VSEQTRDLGATIVQWSGTTESVLQILLDMFRSKKVNVTVFNRLAWNAPKEGFSIELVEDVLRALVISKDEPSLMVAIELADFYFFNKDNPRSCDEELLFSLLTAPCFFGRNHHTRTGFEWYTVARGFRTRFPNRDLDLFAIIISREKNNLGFRHSNYPSQIADAIARDHPDEVWVIVSKILELEEERSWRLEMWLGEELAFGEEVTVGLITVFKPDAVMEWVGRNREQRAHKILRCLPKTLDENRGGKLTRLFIERFGDTELGESLMSHFWIGGWIGPESVYLAGKRDDAPKWVSEIKSGKIIAWLYRYIEYLSKLIARAEMREEREF